MRKTALAATLAATALIGAAPLAGAQDAARSDVSVQGGYDYAGTNIRIWHDPSAGSSVNGHGNQGDGATEIGPAAHSEPFTCDHGGTTDVWFHLRNDRTGISGFVPGCYVTYA